MQKSTERCLMRWAKYNMEQRSFSKADIDAAFIELQVDEQLKWFQRKIADTILEAVVVQAVLWPGRAPQLLYDVKDEKLLKHLFMERSIFVATKYPELCVMGIAAEPGEHDWEKCAELNPAGIGDFMVFLPESELVTEATYYGNGNWDDMDNNNIQPTHWRKKLSKPKI